MSKEAFIKGISSLGDGMSRLIGMYPRQIGHVALPTEQEARQMDAENLADDWQRVGDDLRTAMPFTEEQSEVIDNQE